MDGNRRFRRIHCEVAVGTSVTRRTNTHCDGAELFIYGNSMGCNSIMVDRLLLIPPFHLALLKHEGLPVTLIASMDANRNAEDVVKQAPPGERVGVYLRERRAEWRFFGTAQSLTGLRDCIDAAWTRRVRHVDLLRMPDWRYLQVLAVRGDVVSVLGSDRPMNPGAGADMPASRRIEPGYLENIDWRPISRAAEILGLAIGAFNVFVDADGRILIDGFSDRIPWRRYCTIDGEFDPAPAVAVLQHFFRLQGRESLA